MDPVQSFPTHVPRCIRNWLWRRVDWLVSPLSSVPRFDSFGFTLDVDESITGRELMARTRYLGHGVALTRCCVYWNISSMSPRKGHRVVEYFVSGVALSMLRRGIFHQWRHAINIPSQDIFGIKWRELYSWHYQCCIVENYKYISSMAEYFDDALSIFDREKFQKWHNVTSWNISSMASHYQCCMAEYFDIILSILDRGKFQKWHNVTSWNILTSHYRY